MTFEKLISIYRFDDPFLKTFFKEHARAGDCAITGRREPCIDPEIIRSHFDHIVQLYKPYPVASAPGRFEAGSTFDDGTYIWDAIYNDFGVFSPENDAENNQAILEILYPEDTREGTSYPFLHNPVVRFDQNSFHDEEMDLEHEYWKNFKSEIRYANRFFPDLSLNLEQLREVFKFREYIISPGETYYRARKSDEQLPPEKMGSPPRELSLAGRANPRGIPYLYLGKTETICKKEIRVTTEPYTLATFTISQPLRIVDLSTHSIISPFPFGPDLAKYVSHIDIMKMYIREMSSPADSQDPYLDYLPTQYICERIKKDDYDGILYRSSMADGLNDLNLTLFNTTKVICVRTELRQQENVSQKKENR